MVKGNSTSNESSDEGKENSEVEMEEEASDEESMQGENGGSEVPRVYLPSQETNSEGPLECDESAYLCLHTFKAGKKKYLLCNTVSCMTI